MHLLSNLLTQAFSLSAMLGFVAGIAVTIGYYWLRARWLDHRDPATLHRVRFSSLTLLWSLVFIVTGYIGFAGQQTANDVRALAADTRECSRQFNAALSVRGPINDANDELAKEQRHWSNVQIQAIADFLREILKPPPDIQQIRDTDPNFGTNPHYVQWTIDTITKYSGIIDAAQVKWNAAQAQQDANTAKRPAYPEPTCGK